MNNQYIREELTKNHKIMCCRYCGKVIENDSSFCSFCGKQLLKKNEANTIQLDPRVTYGAVFSAFIDEDNANELIELDPCADNSRKVSRGYIESRICYVTMQDIIRRGRGPEAGYYTKNVNGDYRMVKAYLNDGKGVFVAQFWKDGDTLRFSSVKYSKSINDNWYHAISCARNFYKKKQRLLGLTLSKDYYMEWWAEHYPTTERNELVGTNIANEVISIEEWMDKYGAYFWADVHKYFDDLEHLLGVSPYDFFEYEKYKQLCTICHFYNACSSNFSAQNSKVHIFLNQLIHLVG